MTITDLNEHDRVRVTGTDTDTEGGQHVEVVGFVGAISYDENSFVLWPDGDGDNVLFRMDGVSKVEWVK